MPFYLDAFHDLDADRPEGMALIPWTAFKLYADEYELKDYERESFYYIMRRVDIWHTQRLQEKFKQKWETRSKT